MPARDVERRPERDLGPDAAPPQHEPALTKFSDQGDLPAVSGAQGGAAATASEMAFGTASPLDSGMHEVYEYRDACMAAGKSDQWQVKYEQGHTEARGFTQPYDRNSPMFWTLNKGHSASQALKDFIAGPTIADYRVIGVALELDQLRDDLGDRKFDQLFGSKEDREDAAIPHDHRLEISADMYTTPFVDKMKAIAADYDARPNQDALPPPVQEQRDDDKPKQNTLAEDPVIVAEDLGKRPQRELM